MSSILLSSKLIRCFTGCTRSIHLSTARFKARNTYLIKARASSSSFSTSTVDQAHNLKPQHERNSLERVLQDINHDVLRVGRITRKDIMDVFEEINESGAISSSQSLLVIRCCGSLLSDVPTEARTKLVQELWHKLQKYNVPLDVSHYNALLRVYLENEHLFSPIDFLAELEKKNIEPNRVTYQRLTARYCQAGDIDGATKMLQFMKDKQIPVNEAVFNALILGHSEAGDMKSAAETIDIMKQADLIPSSETYTTLICGYAKRGDIETVKALIERCSKEEVNLYDKDYLEIIYTFTVSGHEEHVGEILPLLHKGMGFNSEVVNLVLRLTNNGFVEVPYQLLKCMIPSSGLHEWSGGNGMFFLRQIIACDRPAEEILKFCERMESDGINKDAFLLAVKYSLTRNNPNTSLTLLEAVQEKGLPIRPHFFYPLFCSARGNDKEIENIITKVSCSFPFQLPPDTVRRFIIPNMRTTDPNKIFVSLTSNGLPPRAVVQGIVYNLLGNRKLKEAAYNVSRMKCFYPAPSYRTRLADAFFHTKDVQSVVKFLQHVHYGWGTLNDDSAEDIAMDSKTGMGTYVFELCRGLAYNNQGSLAVELLQGLVDKGIAISQNAADAIQRFFEDRDIPEFPAIMGLLKQITMDLTPQAVTMGEKWPAVEYSEETLLRVIELSVQQDSGDLMLKKQRLLSCYCRQGNQEKAEVLFQELEKDTHPKLYIEMLRCCIKNGDAQKLWGYYEKFLQAFPGGYLTFHDTADIAVFLAENDHLDKSFAVIDKYEGTGRDPDMFFSPLKRAADKGLVEVVNKLFEVVAEKEGQQVTGRLLGCLVAVHIARGDAEKAVEVYEHCVEKYAIGPQRRSLLQLITEKEDPELLQRAIDAGGKVRGEMNSLYDLIFVFVDNGRIRMARKILETPGLKVFSHRISKQCAYYCEEKLASNLENLLDVTKDFNTIDRTEIFEKLLSVYSREGNVNKALDLWTRMQDEGLSPSDEFLRILGKLLQLQGENVPFIVPETGSESSNSGQKSKPKKEPVKSEEIVARKRISEMPYEDIKNLVNAWLETGLNGVKNIPVRSFPVALREVLAHEPSLLPQVEKKAVEVALKTAEYACLEVTWSSYLSLPEYREKALEIYNTYLQDRKMLRLNHVLRVASEQMDEELIEMCLAHYKNHPFGNEYERRYAHATAIKIYATNNKLDKAVELARAAADQFFESRNLSNAINLLEDRLQAEGMPALNLQFRTVKGYDNEEPSKARVATAIERGFHTFRSRRRSNEPFGNVISVELKTTDLVTRRAEDVIFQSCDSRVCTLPEELVLKLRRHCIDMEKVTGESRDAENTGDAEESDFFSSIVGFRSDLLKSREEKNWMKYLKDDSGLLFNKNLQKQELKTKRQEEGVRPNPVKTMSVDKANELLVLDDSDDDNSYPKNSNIPPPNDKNIPENQKENEEVAAEVKVKE